METTMTTTRFESLSQTARPRLYQHALKLTRNSNLAHDLVQETLIKAFRHFDQFDPSRGFVNWALRIMTNTYVDMARQKNHNTLSLSDITVNDSTEEVELSDNADLLADVIVSERKDELHSLFAELPAAYSEAIVLSLDGLSYAEIADIQQTTIGTIRSRLHRGREILRDKLVEAGIS